MTVVTAEAIEKGTVTVPRNVKEIKTQYRGRTDIEEVVLHPGIRKIGDGAFEGCTNLKRIIIPDSVEFIGEKAFFGCTSLERFTVDPKNRCYKTVDGVLFSRGMVLIAYPGGSRERDYEPPEDTRAFSDYAFSGNPHIRSIRIGPEVSSLTAWAFSGCRKLSGFLVHGDNDRYTTNGELLLDGCARELLFRAPASMCKDLYLRGVEVLAPGCLSESNNLSSIYFHDALEEVSPDAFGTVCRPKKLFIDRNFECTLPFGFLSKKGEPLEDRAVPGHVFRRQSDGTYRSIGKCRDVYQPFDEMMSARERMFYGVESEETAFRPLKVTDTTFGDIAGLEDAKDLMYKHLILPSKHPELFERFDMEASTGVLLYGPPGTGKTMLARAVASEMDAKFYSIKSTDIRNCYVGESENNIKSLFETARKGGKSVIFFDDFDSIGRERGNSSEPWQSDLIDEILVQMQGLEKHNGNLMVLAATNRPWDIDSALLRSGRFSTLIHVGLPNREAREQIVRHRMGGIPHSKDLDFQCIAERTEGYNAADVEELCTAAKLRRISLMDSGESTDEITSEDFEFALSRVHSSVSQRDLRDIENYRRTGNGPGREDGTYVPKDDKIDGYN